MCCYPRDVILCSKTNFLQSTCFMWNIYENSNKQLGYLQNSRYHKKIRLQWHQILKKPFIWRLKKMIGVPKTFTLTLEKPTIIITILFTQTGNTPSIQFDPGTLKQNGRCPGSIDPGQRFPYNCPVSGCRVTALGHLLFKAHGMRTFGSYLNWWLVTGLTRFTVVFAIILI